MKNERSTLVVFPAFNDYNIEVVVAKDVKLARQKRDKTYGEYTGDFSALHSSDGLGQACIVLPENSPQKLVDATHECFHAVIALLEWSGVEDEETAAYHMGYLTNKVYDFVRSRSKRTRT